MGIHSQMRFRPDLFHSFSTFGGGPRAWNAGIGRLSNHVELNRREILEQTDEHERHLVVCELFEGSAEDAVKFTIKTNLLTKTDSRASIEGDENERIVCQVFLCAVVEKAVWIKFESYWQIHYSEDRYGFSVSYHLDPTNPSDVASKIRCKQC